MSKPITVRATAPGYYNDAYRVEGDEFTIEGEEQFSSRWMVAIGPNGDAASPQPRAKGRKDAVKVEADEAKDLARRSQGASGARQAQKESTMAATAGELTRVIDVAAAADADIPAPTEKE